MSRWYIIHAYSGFENKVKDAILSEATRLGLETQVEAVEVPTEKVTEIRRGKKVTSDRKFFPGYVLAKLAMNDQVYHLVKNTPKVTGFLGPGGKPQAITEAEAARKVFGKGQFHFGFSAGNFQNSGDALADLEPEAVVFAPSGTSASGVLVAAQRTERRPHYPSRALDHALSFPASTPGSP